MRLTIYTFILITAVSFLIGCEDENSFSVKPSLGFLQSSGTILQTESAGLQIPFYANVTRTEAVTVQVGISNIDNLTYGTHYTTSPAPVNNIITLTLQPEETQPSIVFIPINTQSDRTRKIRFQILDVSGNGLTLAQSVTLSYEVTIAPRAIAQPTTIFYDFNDCAMDFNIPSGFFEENEPGSKTDRGWGCRTSELNSSRAPRASAFGGAAGEDRAWLIMNSINIGDDATVTIEFTTYSQFAGPGKISVKWSSDYAGSGNPLQATWHTLEDLDSQFPAAGSQSGVQISGEYENISGAKVYFAFVYTEGLNTSSASYDIDDLTIKTEY